MYTLEQPSTKRQMCETFAGCMCFCQPMIKLSYFAPCCSRGPNLFSALEPLVQAETLPLISRTIKLIFAIKIPAQARRHQHWKFNFYLRMFHVSTAKDDKRPSLQPTCFLRTCRLSSRSPHALRPQRTYKNTAVPKQGNKTRAGPPPSVG